MNRSRSDAAVRDSLMILLVIYAIAALWLVSYRVADRAAAQEHAQAVVPCDTDADCHAKNPGLCKPEEAYCFPR